MQDQRRKSKTLVRTEKGTQGQDHKSGRTTKGRQNKEAAEIDLPPWKTFDVRPHDLRHSYCTMLRDAGVDMKQAIIWMGHADEKMILKIYDHVTPERTKKAVSQVEKMLSGCQNGCQQESKTS